MGGIIRCIKNEYNLDQIENEINRTDSQNDLDGMIKSIKQNYNIYIDDDDDIRKESNHYLDNTLDLDKPKRMKTNSFYIPSSITLDKK